jgi:hypothetical protein
MEESMESALARLRAKTDQELCILIARQLHRSRRLSSGGAYGEAAKDYFAAEALLAVADIPLGERARLERLLFEVRQDIELPVTAVA